MAEYENRERNYNNGLAKIMAQFAMGMVEADNMAKDAYVERQIELMGQEEPNVEFRARTTLIGLEQALETKVSVPKIVLAPSRPIQIEEANMSMDMTVSAHSEEATAVDFGLEAEGEAGVGVGPFQAKLRVKASLAVHHEKKRSSDYTSTTHADLRMTQGEAPEGLMKIIDSLNATTVRALDLNADLIDRQYAELVRATGGELPAETESE